MKRPKRGPHAAVLPPMPLSFEEALSGYLQVNPNDLPHPTKTRKPVTLSPKRRARPKKRKAAKKR